MERICRMSLSEILLSSGLALWMAASAWYALRLPGTRQVLRRLNRFHFWANWSMFGADLDSPPTTLEIEYRDGEAALVSAAWRPAFPGYSSRWRAFFWLPERRVRRRLQDLAIDIKRDLEQAPAPRGALGAKLAIVEKYLEVLTPLSPERRREIRITERAVGASPPTGASAEKVVLTHIVSPHD